jgi:hypothetical protein
MTTSPALPAYPQPQRVTQQGGQQQLAGRGHGAAERGAEEIIGHREIPGFPQGQRGVPGDLPGLVEIPVGD